MAKKKIEVFLDITNENEFDTILEGNFNKLICAEIYCSYFGSCTALDRLFTIIKLDWSDGEMVLLRVLADEIKSLERFRGQSQPFYLFIFRKKIINVLRGVDAIKLSEMAKKEIHYYKMEKEGVTIERQTYDIDEETPEEMEWRQKSKTEKEQEIASQIARRTARQAARKRHRAELMVPYLKEYNFVLFWPQAKHAHPELYEQWDLNNIIMVGREELELTRELAEDILYAGDAPINEASLLALLSAPVLVICFRLLDTDKHFVSLVRKILYEDTLQINEHTQKTAFDLYKSYSLTREEIWRKRKEERMKLKRERTENRARRLSEMRRLARQAAEEAIEARRLQNEKLKLELLKAGDLEALKRISQMPDEEEIDYAITEELPEEEEEEMTEEEDENEYLPPPGLLVPGFYAPPNDVAKVNGLAIMFPNLVQEYVTPKPEFIPPHVLVVLDMSKRYKVIDSMVKYKSAIIHMGIFKMITPFDAVHIAYSVKQYDSLCTKPNEEEVTLAFMLSISKDLPLLELMDFNPVHVSRDPSWGEEECAALFPVDYGVEYPEFEDFDHIM